MHLKQVISKDEWHNRVQEHFKIYFGTTYASWPQIYDNKLLKKSMRQNRHNIKTQMHINTIKPPPYTA